MVFCNVNAGVYYTRVYKLIRYTKRVDHPRQHRIIFIFLYMPTAALDERDTLQRFRIITYTYVDILLSHAPKISQLRFYYYQLDCIYVNIELIHPHTPKNDIVDIMIL